MIRAVAIAVVTLVAGCAAAPPAPPERADGPLLEILATFPAEGAIEAADAFPCGIRTERWLAARGADPKAADAVPVEVSVRTDPAHGGAIAREVPGEAVEFLSTGPAGVDLHAVLSIPDAALSSFATPLRLVPPSLAAGAEHRATAGMEVVDAAPPGRPKDRGTGERVARYARDVEIVLDGRRQRAKVLESTFTARLGMATATRTTELLVVPGRGPVAERWRREVVVLGLVGTVREGVRVRDAADRR